MSDKERETIIEWLYTITGIGTEYWNKKKDDELIYLFEEKLQE